MAMQMNFQSLGFDGIPQQEREANRRYWDSLASLGAAIGEAGKEVDSWQKRKAEEEERKKQWENMLEEQKYRREVDEYNRYYQAERDFKNDQRYIDERRRQMETEKRDADALAAAKSQMRQDPLYSPTRIRMEYGPQAYAAAVARDNAPTYAEYMNAQRDLNNALSQRQILKSQKDAELRDSWMRVADELVASVDDRAARNGIDLSRSAVLPNDRAGLEALRAELEGLRDYLNTAQLHSANSSARVAAINAQIKEIDRRLGQTPNGY